MKNYFFILIICLSFFSCKKRELPVPVNGNPVFKFIGTVNGDSVNYLAGVDNMYMYSGFYKDTQNLMTLKSYFGKDNCSNCEPYLSFEVKDFDVTNTNGLAGTIADLLKGGGTFTSYSLDDVLSNTMVEQFTFMPQTINSGTIYRWDFGDGGTSTMKSPTYIFSTGGMKNVRLITTSGGIIDTLENVINTDFNSPCRVQFTATRDTVMVNSVSVQAFPSSFGTYTWDYGDGNTGLLGPNDTNLYNSNGKYIITLTATTPLCASVFKQNVNISSFFMSPLANYTYQTVDTIITGLAPRINKSAFIITWKKNGVEYRSYKNVHGINQSGNPVFTFTGISLHSNNEHGEKTVKVTGTVDTYLYNVNNWQDSIKIKSNDIVLAAAYP